MTNADCIRRMSDEQLYEFLSEWECGDIDYSITFCDLCKQGGNELNLDCDGCRKHWLQRDAVDVGGLMYWKRNTVFDTAGRKTEPTSSKMEQVDKDINVRSKDGPHIVGKHADVVIIDDSRLTAKCLNCNNSKVCKEKHWDGCVYEPKDEKTCESCRHWKYIAREWQCEACKCQGYEPKDEPQAEDLQDWKDRMWAEAVIEPQTDCPWK